MKNPKPIHLEYLLTAYIFESLSAAGRREVEEHLASCPACRDELAALKSTILAVKGALEPGAAGAAAYSFEERRRQRVLAMRKGGATRSIWRGKVPGWIIAVAAVILVVGLIAPTFMTARGRRDAVLYRLNEVDNSRSTNAALEYSLQTVPSSGAQPLAVGASRTHEVADAPAAPAAPEESPASPPEAGPAALAADTGRRYGGTSGGRVDTRSASVRANRPAKAPAPAAKTEGKSELNLKDLKDEVAQEVDLKREIAAGDTVNRAGRPSVPKGAPLAKGDLLLAAPATTAPAKPAPVRAPAKQKQVAALGLRESLGRDKQYFAEETGGSDQFAFDEVAGKLGEKEIEGRRRGLQEKNKSVAGYGVVSQLDSFGTYAKDDPKERVIVAFGTDGNGVADVAKWSFHFENGRSQSQSYGRPRSPENLLRAFRYWKSLDPALTLETFTARAQSIPSPALGDEGLGQEGFLKRYGVNPFVDARRDHLSTFGMDVSTASYTLARNMLRSGKLPDPKSIRVEEFVNFFKEDPAADPDQVFSVASEGGPSPFRDGVEILKITVKARDLRENERKSAVLTFLVDTSGSMASGVGAGAGASKDVPAQAASSDEARLSMVRKALHTLVDALGPDDRIGIAAFNAQAYLVLSHTPARERERIFSAIDSLTPRGATNVEAGLDLAYRLADEVFQPRAVNRVVLLSDGVANVGERGPEEILKKVQVFARRGIYLSSVGVGMGRYNDSLLESLATRGNGNYAYVDSLAEAQRIFRESLPSTLQVLAQDAKVQVDFNPDVVDSYRLLGYEKRDIADQDFRNDKIDAGEVGPGTTVTVLYELRRRTNPAGDLGRIFLRYLDTGTARVEEVDYPLSPGVLATSLGETSPRLRFIASAAECAELLRESYWSRGGSFAKVLEMLGTIGSPDRERPEWKDLVELAARAQALTVQGLAGGK